MSLRQRLFGPSALDRALDILTEDRKAQAAMIGEIFRVLAAQVDLQRRQFDIVTADHGRPTMVQMRTPAEEARLEIERAKSAGEIGALQDVDALMRDFSVDPRFFGEGATN